METCSTYTNQIQWRKPKNQFIRLMWIVENSNNPKIYRILAYLCTRWRKGGRQEFCKFLDYLKFPHQPYKKWPLVQRMIFSGQWDFSVGARCTWIKLHLGYGLNSTTNVFVIRFEGFFTYRRTVGRLCSVPPP